MKTLKQFDNDLEQFNFSDFEYLDYFGILELGIDFKDLEQKDKTEIAEKLHNFYKKYKKTFIEKIELIPDFEYLTVKIYLKQKAINKIAKVWN